VRRKIDFVNNEKIRPHDARAAFPGDFVATGYVNDIDGCIGEIGAECRGQIVTAALDENQIDLSQGVLKIGYSLQIHGAVFPDRGVRATAGFHTTHAFGGQSAHADQELCVFASVDIIGNCSNTEPIPETPAEAIDQSRLATAYGTGNTNSKGTLRVRV
jgi:hypothetical protein